MVNDTHIFFKPAPRLRDYVDHYWFIHITKKGNFDNSDHYQIHLPTGFIDLYLHYQQSYCEFFDIKGRLTGGSIIIGNRSFRNHVLTSAYSIPFFGLRVRFTFPGFYSLFGIPAHELYNKSIKADIVLGDSFNSLYDKCENARNDAERKGLLDQFFISRLDKNHAKPSEKAFFENIIHCIGLNNGNIKIRDLARYFDRSERSLEFIFQKYMGISPKEYCSVLRCFKVIECLNNFYQINWHDVICDFGYYDQAHFIKNFESFTGVTPDWFLKNKGDKVIFGNSLLVFTNSQDINMKADIQHVYRNMINCYNSQMNNR